MGDIVPGVSKSDAADRGNAEIVRDIVRATRIPLVALDGELRIVGANAAFQELLSTAEQDLLGHPFGSLADGRWNDPGLRRLLQAVRTEKRDMRDVEAAFDTDKGDRRVFLLNARLARTSDATDDTVLLTVEDISEERRAANELRFANAMLTAQMEGSLDGILVVDESARIVSYNRRFLEIWNVPPDLVKTKVDNPVLAYATSQTKNSEAFLARVRYLYEHPEETARDEIELADGRILDRHSTSLRDETGKYLGRVWFFRDITQQRWAEAATQESLARVRKQLQAAGAVSQSQAVISGDVENLARLITELASAAAGCERVNVWLFNDDESELTCIDSYEATPGTHSSGMVLREAEYRHEFEALKNARYVDAHDPLTDPRTAGYVETYLKPLGITSMLDVMVHASGKNLGLLCFEHVGKPHRWHEDEIAFACRLADQIGLAVISRERKRAEEMLVASRDLLSTVVESAPVRIFWKDRELRYLGCNAAFARDAGMSGPEDMIGKDDFQIGWRDQAELYRADDRRVMDSGTPVIGYEEPSTTPDGSTIWLRTSKVPLHDGAGKVMGILGIYEDITERKRAEENLRIANAIVGASPTVLFRWAPAEGWPITYASPNVARIFGYDAAELTDPPKPFGPLVHIDDGARVAREVDEHVAAGRTSFVQEYRLFAKSGEARWVEDATTVERDSEGRVVHYQGTVTDVTERKRAEEELRAKTGRLERFQSLTVGRELDMIRLKQEINALLRELGRAERYEARAAAPSHRAAVGAAKNGKEA